jgi:hypothetical protein
MNPAADDDEQHVPPRSWRTGGVFTRRTDQRAAQEKRPGFVPAAAPLAPSVQGSWRGVGLDTASRMRAWWLVARRIGFTVGAIVLTIMLIRTLLTVRRQVPLVVGFVTSYRPPLPPLELAGEDRELLRGLADAGLSFFDPGTAVFYDESEAISDATADQMVTALTSRLRQVRPGGPDKDVAIVYLSATGTVDEKGRPCIVPPGASEDPVSMTEDAYLPVEHLLASLRQAVPDRVNILVVLDATHAAMDWNLEIDDGGFTPAVESLLQTLALDRVWVMVPSATGQRALASAVQGSGGFAIQFALGMRGAADARPWGDADGRVELKELTRFVADRVDRWAHAMYGDRQTPTLIPALSGDSPDVALAWTVTRNPRDDRRNPVVGGNDWWLEQRWRLADAIRERAIQEKPLNWAAYEHMLLRAETLRTAGSAFHDEQIEVDTAVERMERDLSLPIVTATKLLPAMQLSATRFGVGEAGDADEVAQWRAGIETFMMPGPNQPQPPANPANAGPAPGEPASPVPTAPQDDAAWLLHTGVGWRWLLDTLDSNATFDKASIARWIEWVGTRPEGPVFHPVQLHVIRMLSRWTQDEDWQRNGDVFRILIRLLSRAWEAAYGRDVRVDPFLTSEAVAAYYNEANEEMRRALDFAFVGGPAAMAESRRLATASLAKFDGLVKIADQRARALNLLDTIRAELPFLASWWVGEQRAVARQAGDQGVDPAEAPEFDWPAMLVAVDQLEASIDGAAARNQNIPTGSDTDGELERIRARCDLLFQTLRRQYADACVDLAMQAPAIPRTNGAIRRALAIPLLRGEMRLRLLRRAQELARRFAAELGQTADDEDPLPPSDPKAAVAGWIPWRDAFMHPVVPILVADGSGASVLPTSASEIAVAVGRQASACRNAARSLPTLIARLDRERTESEIGSLRSGVKVLELLARGSHASRRLAVVAGQRPQIVGAATPTMRYLAAAWHTRLVRQARNTLEDFWGAVEPGEPVYCTAKTNMLLETAAEIVRNNGVVFGEVERGAVSARLAELEAGVKSFAQVNLSPNRVMLPTTAIADPPRNTVALDPRAGVPPGIAAAWLSPAANDRPLSILRDPAGGPATSRMGVEVGKPIRATTWQLDPAGAGLIEGSRMAVLDFTAWYRGHRILSGMPVAAANAARTTDWTFTPAADPQITVRGDMPRTQAVAVIFDCSGSMGQRLPDGRTRLDAGRRSVSELLAALAKNGNWDVSLWLYGHRTQWSRDQSGRYTSGLTAAGQAAKAAAEKQGTPFTLVPGDDVEQMLPMQALTPGVATRIDMILQPLAPGGETPLYHAISEALATDFGRGREAVPGHVLVVTDGANDQTGGTIVTAAGVEDRLARLNSRRTMPLRVDIVGFAMFADAMERAMRMGELRDLASASGGRFYEAANADNLARSLRQSLRVLQWQVTGPGAPRDPANLGDSVRLPLSLPGQPQAYEVVLEAGPTSPRRGVAVEGGEGLELFVTGGGRGLECRRYDGGTEQGLRDSRSEVVDPANPRRRSFIGAHMATRTGDTIRFPISVQNANAAEFSPRPVEMWVEVTPFAAGQPTGAPFVVYDLALQPARPVPVFDLVARNWPRNADAAEIRAWFRFAAIAPDMAVPVSELVPGAERSLTIAGFPNSEIRATLAAPDSPDTLRLSVVENHPPQRATQLPALRVVVAPNCLRAVHVVEPETGRVRHEFTLKAEGGRVPANTMLQITDRQRIVNGAASATAGGAPPLAVPVPAE